MISDIHQHFYEVEAYATFARIRAYYDYANDDSMTEYDAEIKAETVYVQARKDAREGKPEFQAFRELLRAAMSITTVRDTVVAVLTHTQWAFNMSMEWASDAMPKATSESIMTIAPTPEEVAKARECLIGVVYLPSGAPSPNAAIADDEARKAARILIAATKPPPVVKFEQMNDQYPHMCKHCGHTRRLHTGNDNDVCPSYGKW